MDNELEKFLGKMLGTLAQLQLELDHLMCIAEEEEESGLNLALLQEYQAKLDDMHDVFEAAKNNKGLLFLPSKREMLVPLPESSTSSTRQGEHQCAICRKAMKLNDHTRHIHVVEYGDKVLKVKYEKLYNPTKEEDMGFLPICGVCNKKFSKELIDC